ncbi:hypothetical protein BABINDRAFT_161763 [Babjeviella inositovora NRRL Y-12698]|uniref:Uncharacterized protein n=1 Tax=Babjeviella inositovora NRRL Y-12698 TaxID=984486 RepID=A0A1E3QNV1_9ASCO|nr:uncharacterized protein BABINDRAFT_161763 [Babjeviella inositovora NRRL Y-12698]ODQ79355.1 hypothetical protein BABINDRAFT_161763 [Babjeviella inositovora NRRL Y-12698]
MPAPQTSKKETSPNGAKTLKQQIPAPQPVAGGWAARLSGVAGVPKPATVKAPSKAPSPSGARPAQLQLKKKSDKFNASEISAYLSAKYQVEIDRAAASKKGDVRIFKAESSWGKAPATKGKKQGSTTFDVLHEISKAVEN